MKYCSICKNVMSIIVIGNKPSYECNLCKNVEEIASGAVIYENKRSRKLNTASDEVLINTPTLRRTKDYICPNKECGSHSPAQATSKEAVFYRTSAHSFEIEYLCTTCKTRFSP